MKRAGFTLIEIMIVVGIIAIMLVTAVMKEATRGVVQLSRYAASLALLRQRPVVVTFHKKGKVEVRISGETSGSGEKGAPSDPIYLEVNGEVTQTAAELAAEAQEDGEDGTPAASSKEDRKGLFYTRQALNPDELAKEDAEGEYDGVVFTVEVLDEEGNVLTPEQAAARSLRQPERKKPAFEVFNSLDIGDDGKEDEKDPDDGEEPVSVTYETNGNVNPHRIIVRMENASATDEGFAINISRSGKATVGDDDGDDSGRRRNARRR